MDKFTKRLRWCMKVGVLTVSDMARLFDRERRTVSDWVHNGRIPTGVRAVETVRRLSQLERQIERGEGFPVPLRLSKRARTEYIRLLSGGKIGRARILADGVTTRRARVVRGIRGEKGSRVRGPDPKAAVV